MKFPLTFDGELILLEEHAEWDKFTIAFFGETNAGKSTIIESLRILFREESRQQLLQDNANDVLKFEHAIADHLNQARQGMLAVYVKYAGEIASIKQGASALGQVVRAESGARVKRKLWLVAIAAALAGVLLSSLVSVFLKG